MQYFNLNDRPVRFFNANETIYLITADANKAFGFEGEGTTIDQNSVILSSLTISTHESFILPKGIQSNSLVIEFKDLVRVIIRSSKSELSTIQDIFCQMVVNGVTQRTQSPQQQALPPATDTARTENMSQAVCKRYLDVLPLKTK